MTKSMIGDRLIRAALGTLFGLCLQVLLASLWASLFSPRLEFSMMIFSSQHPLPYDTSERLSTLLMMLIGAEIGLSTLPFSEYGKSLRLETVLHFALMMLTVAALGWVLGGRQGIIEWLLPAALLYVLIWLDRWVGWYAELGQIREKLGIAPKPSPLKWRETLPHIGFAFLLCAVLPLALSALDPDHILSLLFILLFIPAVGFVTGMSLGKLQGFCPLYPVACGVFVLTTLPLIDAGGWWISPAFALAPALLGNLLSAAIRAGKAKLRAWEEEP